MIDQPASVISSTEVPNLYVMTAGPMPPNPSELLASDKMLKVVSWMKEQFEMVVIDSTPLLLVPDAQALIPRADGIVLVAMLGKTKRKSMASAAHILKLAKANVLGVISRDRSFFILKRPPCFSFLSNNLTFIESAFGTILRNLYIVKILPSLPTRF